MSQQPSVAIVIIHWNNRHLLESFLPGVLASAYLNLKIVLADNASTDDSVAYVQQNFPSVQVVQLDQNYGYAAGYNKALQQVDADYYILLNNDVEVIGNWFEPIIQQMEMDQTIAAAQPKLLMHLQKTYFEYAGASGGYMDKYGYIFCRGRIFEVNEVDEGQYQSVEAVFWASGACKIVRAKTFHELGGFDTDFFAHMEEVDLCWRMQLAGYKIMVYPECTVFHVGGSTLQQANPEKTYLNFRNSLIMLLKNMPAGKLWWFIPLRASLDLLSSIFFLLNAKPAHSWAIHRAHAHFFFRFRYWFKKRAAIVRQKKHADIKGIYQGSVIWEHFVLRKQYFSDFFH